jgi:NADPH-dependent 2,4-dienoyl-CoA reductase/sulfur reductase-like enzyme
VVADDGTEEDYDRLLLATGSTPFILPVPGNDLPGVISYRDIKDTDEMIDRRHAQARGGDRRRPARPGSGQRPQAARHGCHRGAPDALADGAPARQPPPTCCKHRWKRAA